MTGAGSARPRAGAGRSRPRARRAAFDPFATLVRLGGNGRAQPLAWTRGVFRRLRAADRDRVVGMKHGAVPADFHADEWERHPAGDELLYLVTGALQVILEAPGGERRFRLRGGRACLVPRGTWHRLVVRQPSDLLFITPARGTQHRAADRARPR
jgi:mannose-6-phosphate isomerase-like protein (cupin superfamily)